MFKGKNFRKINFEFFFFGMSVYMKENLFYFYESFCVNIHLYMYALISTLFLYVHYLFLQGYIYVASCCYYILCKSV